MINEGLEQLSSWHREGFDQLQLAINISGIQIQRDNLVEQIDHSLQRLQIDPESVELEITESVLIDFPERATDVLMALRDLGVSLALDDFGTDYSSLSNLKRYPITALKVDKSFVRDILEDPNDAAITRAVVAMGQSLDIHVVAEGWRAANTPTTYKVSAVS
ncbi:EAL domain-containing protein [Candidatus Reidiella endopervernicosa]|uniref:EAL domain-containing protein n=1 Tax=Candidatus Reidiella endopervernicosa TaxID=2738883 RepID=A0A6N0HZQ2_9GAMM|nr:EAL domain-containing protein [Candidatus Reidiella endopervernicosa]